MLEDLLNLNTEFITDNFVELLKYEEYIEIKKANNIELTDEEKIFDDIIVKPSLIARILLKRIKDIKDKESE